MIRWLAHTLTVLTTLLLPCWGHPQSFDEVRRAVQVANVSYELTLRSEFCRGLPPGVTWHCAAWNQKGRAFFVIEYVTPRGLSSPSMLAILDEERVIWCDRMRTLEHPAQYVEAFRWSKGAQAYDCQAQIWLPPFQYDDTGITLRQAPGQW